MSKEQAEKEEEEQRMDQLKERIRMKAEQIKKLTVEYDSYVNEHFNALSYHNARIMIEKQKETEDVYRKKELNFMKNV